MATKQLLVLFPLGCALTYPCPSVNPSLRRSEASKEMFIRLGYYGLKRPNRALAIQNVESLLTCRQEMLTTRDFSPSPTPSCLPCLTAAACPCPQAYVPRGPPGLHHDPEGLEGALGKAHGAGCPCRYRDHPEMQARLELPPVWQALHGHSGGLPRVCNDAGAAPATRSFPAQLWLPGIGDS